MRFGESGFTLVELAAAVVIIAVITVTGLVSFSTLTGSRLEAEARKISADLGLARERSVARHTDCVIDFDTANNGYSISQGASNIKRQDLEIDLVSVTDSFGNIISPPRVTFYFPKGNSQDRLINLSYKGQTKQVRVFAGTGYLKVQ